LIARVLALFVTTWNPESDRKARPNHHDKQHAEAHGTQAPRARSGSRRWATIGGDRGRTKLKRPANGLCRGQGGPVRSEPPFRLSDANLRLGAEPLIEMTTPPWVWPCRPLRSSSRVPGGSPPSTPTVALAPPDARAAWSRRRWSRCHSGPAAGPATANVSTRCWPPAQGGSLKRPKSGPSALRGGQEPLC
jgi:hypothetical protein